MAPQRCRSTNRQPEPEVYFRIVHAAQNIHNFPPVATYREQTVEIALGPKGAFENGNLDAMTRRVSANDVVSAAPTPRGQPKLPKGLRKPRVVELLRKAIEWQRQLNAGEVRTQADIADRERITRARVTQVTGMLGLPPEIQQRILSLPDTLHRPPVTERAHRPIRTITNSRDQLREFHKLLVQAHPSFCSSLANVSKRPIMVDRVPQGVPIGFPRGATPCIPPLSQRGKAQEPAACPTRQS